MLPPAARIVTLGIAYSLLCCFCALASPDNKNKTPLTPIAPRHELVLELSEQPLSDALRMLSGRYQMSFVAPEADIAQLTGSIPKGRYSLGDALSTLLKDTPLRFSLSQLGFSVFSATPTNITKVDTPAQDEPIEEVAVTGLRQSLLLSRDRKRDSIGVTDVIASHDMARYPDLNLAESLQRIPGITITREAGEGRQINLRGLHPDFTLVTLNGMPVLANNDSPMDSRIQKLRDRSFDLNLFSSELFNQIQIHKSYRASQTTGGVAGTAALQTAHPFDDPGFNIVLSPQVGINQYSKSLAPKMSAMLSNTKDEWGALFSVAFSTRESQERGANTFRWRNLMPIGADVSALDNDIAQSWQNGELFIPRGNRYSVWRSDMERLGVGLSLQRKTSSSDVTMDVIHGRLEGDRLEFHLYPRGSQSTPVIEGVTRITHAQVNQQNELVYARYENARVGTESRKQVVSTRYNQWVLNGKFNVAEDLLVTTTLGREHSSYDIPVSNKAYMLGSTDISVDYRQDRYFADVVYDDDLTDPHFWQMRELDLEAYEQSSQFDVAKMQVSKTNKQGISWEVGAEYIRFHSKSRLLDQQNLLLEQWAAFQRGVPAGELDEQGVLSVDSTLNAPLAYVMTDHPKTQWLALNTNEVFGFYNLSPSVYAMQMQVPIEQRQDRITEHTMASYGMLSWKQGDWVFHGAVRVQYDRTRINSPGVVAGPLRNIKYASLLPSFDAQTKLNQQWLMRLSMSQNIAKPFLDDLSSEVRYDETFDVYQTFNPGLKPYKSNNLDWSIEAYWDKTSSFALSVFGKYIDDYVVTTTTTSAFEDSPLAAFWQGEPIPDGQIITVLQRENAESAWIAGAEISVQCELDVFDNSARHFGIAASMTVSDSQVRYYDDRLGSPLEKKALPFMSPVTGSLTLYYESYDFSARIAASYRDSYIASRNTRTRIDEDENGFHETWYIDAIVTHQLTDGWEVRAEAINLTNQREEQYSDSANRAYNTTTSGRNYYVGLTYRY